MQGHRSLRAVSVELRAERPSAQPECPSYGEGGEPAGLTLTNKVQ